MGDERPCGGPAGQRLQDGSFDLEEPASLECISDGAYNSDPLARHRTRLRPDDQVDIPLPYPCLFTHLFVGDGQGSQRLGRHLPGIGEDGQFASA